MVSKLAGASPSRVSHSAKAAALGSASSTPPQSKITALIVAAVGDIWCIMLTILYLCCACVNSGRPQNATESRVFATPATGKSGSPVIRPGRLPQRGEEHEELSDRRSTRHAVDPQAAFAAGWQAKQV